MTENQHYIPQFYQKYWECERKGYIWEFDKKYSNGNNRGIRQQAIRTRNSVPFLYEADEHNPTNATENWYGKFESIYSNRIKTLLSRRACLQMISEVDKLTICRLYANFSARNPMNLYNNPFNNMLASHFTLGEPNPHIDRRHIQNLIAFSEGAMMEIFGGDSHIMGDFEKELLSSNLQILISNEANIVFCDSIISQVRNYNELFFPICPSLVAYFSRKPTKYDRIIRKITEDEYTIMIRVYLLSQNVRKIYANSRATLETVYNYYKSL